MKPIASVSSLTLSSGQVVHLGGGACVIVGPNNVGKSALLRDIQALVPTPVQHRSLMGTNVAKDLGLHLQPRSTISRWLETNFAQASNQPADQTPGNRHFRGPNGEYVLESDVLGIENSDSPPSTNGVGFLVQLLDAETRLQQLHETTSIDLFTEIPTSPLQKLFADPGMEKAVSELSSTAFGQAVTLNRYAGGHIRLHLGSTKREPDGNPPSREYLEDINSLPRIDQQGDGFRAFIGMAVAVITGTAPILLIDEPEAFLHPPQARLFGKFLAAQSNSGRQLIVSTHSEDVLSGLTSVRADEGAVEIVRLTRTGNRNNASRLSPEAAAALSRDPLMRYHNMLNGMFSLGVVLCESDHDCTYYRAVADDAGARRKQLEPFISSHVTHAGGKSRISRAITAFKHASVPVAAIFDIDILQGRKDVENVITAVGASIEDYSSRLNVVSAAVRDNAQKFDRRYASQEIQKILEGGTGSLGGTDRGKINTLLRADSGWKQFKTSGRTMLSADALVAFDSLCEDLEEFGIFIVAHGELERFHPALPQNDKAEWLRRALDSRELDSSPSIPMLLRLSEYIESRQDSATTNDHEESERSDGQQGAYS